MKIEMSSMHQVMLAEQGVSTTTLLSDLIVGEKVILERTGMKEDIKKQVRSWVKNAFYLSDKEQKIIDNEDVAKGVNRYNVYDDFRHQMDEFGLAGSLKNMSLIQIEDVDKIKKYQYFKGKYLKDNKVLVMSADYQLNGAQKGRVHKLFVFRMGGYLNKLPVFESPRFIELPGSVQLCLRSGMSLWKHSKIGFEELSKEEVC